MRCPTCETEHDGSYGSGRFCCQACARSYSSKEKREDINRAVSQKLKGIRPTSPRIGPCSESIRQSISDGMSKFQQHSLLEWAEKWNSGQILVGNPSRRLRKAIILLRGDRCEQCGWCEINPVHGNVPIQLHHRDGDRKNNKPENVQLLCPNCHSLTPNYMVLNAKKPIGSAALKSSSTVPTPRSNTTSSTIPSILV